MRVDHVASHYLKVLHLMRPLRCCTRTVEEGFQTSDASCVGDGFQLGIRDAELWRLSLKIHTSKMTG